MAQHYFRTLSLALVLCALQAYADLTVSVSASAGVCSDPYGSMTAYASGGLPPYTYAWSPGNPAGQGTATITGLSPGMYTVTVTDDVGTTVQASGEVLPPGNLNYPVFAQILPGCGDECGAVIQLDESSLGGVPPYYYSVTIGGAENGIATIGGICSDGTPITVTDANGCAVSFVAQGTWQPEGSGPQVLATVPACGAQANGAVTVGPDNGPAWYRVFNNTFDSVYAFSAGPYTIGGLLPDDYTVGMWDPADPMGLGTGNGWWVYCAGTSTFTVPSMPEPCGMVSGRVFHDADQDCVQGPYDISLPYRVVGIEPGPVYGITNGSGDYLAHVDYGTYTISQEPAGMEQLCPAQLQVPFTVDGLTPQAVVDFADSSTTPHDISVHLDATVARVGHPFSVAAALWNNSIYPSGDLDITMSYDNVLGSPVPADGHWTSGPLPPFLYNASTHTLHAVIPDDVSLIGTMMNFSVTVTNTEDEVNTANNTATLAVEIMGPYDPNDLAGVTDATGSANSFMLADDEWIEYTVRFQNTGNAPASTVVVRDTLPAALDMATLQVMGATHAFTPSFGEGRALAFTFNGINLPDSGSDFLGSQGSVKFRIGPRGDIAAGDVIQNTAGIYFDSNPPVITNTTAHVVETSTGITGTDAERIQLVPNPTDGILDVQLPEGVDRAFSVWSADGRRVAVPFMRTGTTLRLDVHALAPGLYVLRTGNGVARFVKH